MTDDLEERIRHHAYLMWEAAGCPEGEDEAFWHAARQELAPSDHPGTHGTEQAP